jgi:hypothetical protein
MFENVQICREDMGKNLLCTYCHVQRHERPQSLFISANSVIFRIQHIRMSQFEECANIKFYVQLDETFSQTYNMIRKTYKDKARDLDEVFPGGMTITGG